MGIVERLRDPVNNWNSGGRFAAADLIERLRRYARHNRNCPVIYGATDDQCLCGLTALIKEIEGE